MLKRTMNKIADDIAFGNGTKPIRVLRRIIDCFKIPSFPERHKDRIKGHPFTTARDIKKLKQKLFKNS